VEQRTVESRTGLTLVPPWPGLAQILKVTRRRTLLTYCSWETVFYITSLSRREAPAARLLQLIRGHWAIENRLHYIRDQTFDEDASRVRKGHGPENMALLRNLTLGLCRRSPCARGRAYIPSILRAHQADPHVALALIRPDAPPVHESPAGAPNTT
jgi:hypothetical protein